LFCKMQNQVIFFCVDDFDRFIGRNQRSFITNLSSTFWIKWVLSKTIWHSIFYYPLFEYEWFHVTFCLIVTYKCFYISGNQHDQSSVETSDAARERFFCSCIAMVKPASSSSNPFLEELMQSSQLETEKYHTIQMLCSCYCCSFSSSITLSSNCNPWSKVLKKMLPLHELHL
jgi:hypothetical protein